MERVWSISSSSSSSSSPSPTTMRPPSTAEEEEEMEAAEALADLAQLAVREIGGGGGEAVAGGGGGIWGGKGKRAKSRVKSVSPPVDPLPETEPDPLLENGGDAMAVDQQHCESISTNVVLCPVKEEPDFGLTKPSTDCVRSYSLCGGGRLRLNLTEAEKEERRLRRILANRESARQTIRRRQALCEELTRKAADLVCDNENLKREKELALKEYQSLENTNKQLKVQIIKAMKSKAEESEGDLKCSRFDMPAATSVNGLLLYNQHPFSQLCWPHTIQSPVQSQEQQENPTTGTVQKMPLYLVPCPWFFHVPDQGNGLNPQHSAGTNNIQVSSSINNGLPSKFDVFLENETSLPIKAKLEPGNLEAIRVIGDLNEMPVEFSLDEASCYVRKQPPSGVTSGFAVKEETDCESGHNPVTDGIYEKAIEPMRTREQRIHHPSDEYHSRTATAAAAARRRRRELTKLKNLQSRQCRMKC